MAPSSTPPELPRMSSTCHHSSAVTAEVTAEGRRKAEPGVGREGGGAAGRLVAARQARRAARVELLERLEDARLALRVELGQLEVPNLSAYRVGAGGSRRVHLSPPPRHARKRAPRRCRARRGGSSPGSWSW